jgi:type VI secretion system protein ImpE
MKAEQLLAQGDLQGTLQQLQQVVREHPADPCLRIFLFQLLCVSGDWQRALQQLQLSGELDPDNLPMVQTYREAIACELFRLQVFAGRQSPLVFGDPPPWVALLVEVLRLNAEGKSEHAKALQCEAFEKAPAIPGQMDETPFAWLSDADQSIGPIMEVIINGRYYWMPMQHLSRIEIEPPVDLRDLVWVPARLHLINGGTLVALIPSRYSNTEMSGDDALMLSRKTVWQERADNFFTGLGQRMFTSDLGEQALLNIRTIQFEAA